MKIDLGRADLGALRLDLPGGPATAGTRADQAIAIRSAQSLRGTVEQTGATLSLSDVAAEVIVLDALRLLLGELVLAAGPGAELAGLGVTLQQAAERLTLAATLTAITASELAIDIGDVRVRGNARLLAPALVVNGDEGSLASSEVEIADFALRLGALEIAVDVLRGTNVKILWGEAGFRLAAGTLAAGTLRVANGDLALSAHGVEVDAFVLDGPSITVNRAALSSGHVALALHPPKPKDDAAARTPPSAPEPREPVVDLAALDRLAGQLDVDVAVDISVPISGHRKATHRLRIAIADGALDFRALEHNLAKLEDALLDFSVRDHGLVLERVNPLFPARGRGKPIVRWDMTGADLALAREDRVRLAVLPKAQLATDGSSTPPPPADAPPPSKSGSGIALRELGLLRISARLSLGDADAPLDGRIQLHHVKQLVLGGNVFHEPGGSREGSLLGELTGLALSIDGLPLGDASRLTVTSVTAEGLAPIEAAFVDLALMKLEVGLSALVLEGVAVTL